MASQTLQKKLKDPKTIQIVVEVIYNIKLYFKNLIYLDEESYDGGEGESDSDADDEYESEENEESTVREGSISVELKEDDETPSESIETDSVLELNNTASGNRSVEPSLKKKRKGAFKGSLALKGMKRMLEAGVQKARSGARDIKHKRNIEETMVGK